MNTQNPWGIESIESTRADIETLLSDVVVDFGGGCSVRKATAIAYLIQRFKLATALDIGVYRGRSFLPMCLAMSKVGRGIAVAVDPWSRLEARERDNPQLRKYVDAWIDALNFEAVFQGVLQQLEKHGLNDFAQIRRTTSTLAAKEFAHEGMQFDLIHVDGNHDTQSVLDDIAAYLPLLVPGGFLVIDDVSWGSVRPALLNVLAQCLPVSLRTTSAPEDDYAIFYKPAHGDALQTALRELPHFVGDGAVFGEAVRAHILEPKPSPFPVISPEVIASARLKKLLICDDFFPNVLTAFRVAEYNTLMDRFPNAVVRSWSGRFREIHSQYAMLYPEHAKRVAPCTEYSFARVDFVYTNFLNNAVHLLTLGVLRCPFAFVLYPGGGFGLDDSESDAKLRFVLASEMLRAVVVTTSVTEAYLRDRMRQWDCDTAIEIVRVDGVVVASDSFLPEVGVRPYWCLDGSEWRDVLNICFAANKYMPRLEHKGYQEFVFAARAAARRYPFVRLHVVGGADASDGDFEECESRVTFHGAFETSALRDFFHHMDVIVSPSLVGKDHTGQFDGFPTGTCVEAALCGVAMVVTNPLSIEEPYSQADAVKIVEPTAEAVTAGLFALIDSAMTDHAFLRGFAQRGREVSRERYNLDTQMQPRIDMLLRHLCNSTDVR